MATQQPPSEERAPTSEQDRLIEEIRRAGDGMFTNEQLSPLLNSTLTMQQLRLIVLLRAYGPLGGHELARHLSVSMPTVSGIVDRLVERGMVERREDASDRRVRLSALTAAGEAFIAESENAGWAISVEILGAMEVEDLRALARGISAMRRAVEDRRRGAGPYPPPTSETRGAP